MKTLMIPLEENEYKQLIKAKGGKTWKQFLFECIKERSGKDEDIQKGKDV